MKCPICESENSPGLILCHHCGSDLYTVLLEQVSTSELRDKQTDSVKSLTMPSSKPIVVYIRNAREPLSIQRKGKITLGRKDPTLNNPVDIDLTPYGAEEMGVSRHHASIDTSVTPPILLDMGSYNGTYINGQQLIPQQEYYLQSSDEIRFGRMILRIFYDN